MQHVLHRNDSIYIKTLYVSPLIATHCNAKCNVVVYNNNIQYSAKHAILFATHTITITNTHQYKAYHNLLQHPSGSVLCPHTHTCPSVPLQPVHPFCKLFAPILLSQVVVCRVRYKNIFFISIFLFPYFFHFHFLKPFTRVITQSFTCYSVIMRHDLPNGTKKATLSCSIIFSPNPNPIIPFEYHFRYSNYIYICPM